jgi:prepilin-type N-terminal cleavage/methylation domain-containing protein
MRVAFLVAGVASSTNRELQVNLREAVMYNRKGFTLIELLIVVVIIGILAAIAIPKFAATKEKAYLASMKSDLRNLATAEEGYFADNTNYLSGTTLNQGGTVTPLNDGTNDIFTPSTGVQVVVTNGTAGWSAVATHLQTTKSCAMYIGAANTQAPAVTEGEPRCDP